MGNLKEQTISGVKWNVISRFSSQGISFIIGLILARLLVPADYGIVGMVGIFFAIANTFIDSGFGSALIRKNNCSETDYSTAFYFNTIVGLACCVILSISAPFIADFFNTPILKKIIVVMSINMFIGSLTIVQGTRLTKAVDFKSHAKISIISTLVSGTIGITLAYNGAGVWSLIWQGVTASIIRAICLSYITRWYPKWCFSRNSFKYLFNFGGKILIASLLHTIYSNLSTLIIGKFYSPKDLGFYTRGENMATLPSTNITGVLQGVTYPILSKIQDDEKRLIEVYRKYISITSLVIFFAMLLLAALAKPLIITLLTDKWSDCIIYLQIFCIALMFDHICQLNLNILYVKGRSDLVLRLEVIKKTISISMLIAAIPFGVLAMCITRAIYTQIAIIINTYYTGKLFGLGYWTQVKDYSMYLILSLIAISPAIALTLTDLHPTLILIAGSAIAVSTYWIMLRKDDNYKEIISIIKRKNK